MSKDLSSALTTLSPDEFEMIIEGVDQLKSKDFAPSLLGLLLKGLVKKEDMTPEERQRFELQEEKEKIEKELKEKEVASYKRKCDLLKAKLIILKEQVHEGVAN